MAGLIDMLPAALAGDAHAMECLAVVADKVAANCGATNGQVYEAIAYALMIVSNEFERDNGPMERVMAGISDGVSGATVSVEGVETLHNVFDYLGNLQTSFRDEGRQCQASGAHSLRVATANLINEITGESLC